MIAKWMKDKIPVNRFDFAGRTVIITGGGQGIGRCIALSYAANGARTIVLDRNRQAGLETIEMIEQLVGVKAWHFDMDLQDEDSMKLAVQSMISLLDDQGVTALINNGAIANAHAASLKDNDLTAFDQVLSVNLRGSFAITRLLLPWLKQASGSIVNLGSTRSIMSEPDSEAYAASKGGITALTHAMAVSLANSGIRVNCISPGWILTEAWQLGSPPEPQLVPQEHQQHPAGRIGKPVDIAAACLFLTSEDAGFITGVNLTIDGGMTRKMIYI